MDPDRRQALAGHVARARDGGVSLLMVHEADLTRDGCEFGMFFQSVSATPIPATHSTVNSGHPLQCACLKLAAVGCALLQTPQSLIDDGIYQQLAFTWFEPPHREISVALTAKKLGAEQVKKTLIPRVSAEMMRRTTTRAEMRPTLSGVERGAASQEDSCADRKSSEETP